MHSRTGALVEEQEGYEEMLEDGKKLLGDIFIVYEVLGHGGAGIVYRCKNRVSTKEEAVNVMKKKLNKREEARLEREISVLGKLNHRNIVTFLSAGSAQGRRYLEFEFLGKESMEQVIRAGALSETDAVDMAMQCLDALDFIHKQGYVHRDIKPANIMRVAAPDGRGFIYKLIDFGLVVNEEADMSRFTTAAIGTQGYMPPERYMSPTHIAASDDIWAMAVTMYAAVTGGKLPFNWETRSLFPIPGSEAFRRCIEGSLANELADRIKTAEEMKHVLHMARYDVFISYRAAGEDAELASALFEVLQGRKFTRPSGVESTCNVYLDKKRIRDGQDWQVEFFRGLVASDLFVPILSPAVIERFSKLDPPEVDAMDNILLEQTTALALKHLGVVRKMLPVMVGRRREDGSWGRLSADTKGMELKVCVCVRVCVCACATRPRGEGLAVQRGLTWGWGSVSRARCRRRRRRRPRSCSRPAGGCRGAWSPRCTTSSR